MISVTEAQAILHTNLRSLGTELVPLKEANGRILRETITTDRPQPPFNRVAMDGIALRHTDFANGQRTFPVVGISPAGTPVLTMHEAGQCIEVMTGGVLPIGTDTVIRYEDIQLQDGQATIQLDMLTAGKNIHPQGKDQAQGAVIGRIGSPIDAALLGIAAAMGKAQLLVSKRPKVAIISTGDELVPVDVQPEPHQIRRSNAYMIRAALADLVEDVDDFHIPDNYATIQQRLNELLQEYDILVLSGGVSMGKFDYLPKALKSLEVEQLLHKVKQRPGKPFWFGLSEQQQAVVFALPGNPVSSLVCTLAYVRPWLRNSQQQLPIAPTYAQLTKDFVFKPDLDYFLQVHLSSNATGTLLAHPDPGNGSGDFTNLVHVDAFLHLPRGRDNFAAGEAFPVFKLR